MADVIDMANDVNELHFEVSLRKALTTKRQAFSGFCLYCEEPVGQQRYCGPECRIDHEKQIKKLR